MNKQIVDTAVADLPNEFSLDDLFEKLRFVENVNAGLKDVEQGKVHATEEARIILSKWL